MVAGTIGTEELGIQLLNVSPNPTNGWVTWNIPFEGWFEVLALDGKILKSGQLPDPIDLTDVPNGSLKVIVYSKYGTKSFSLLKVD